MPFRRSPKLSYSPTGLGETFQLSPIGRWSQCERQRAAKIRRLHRFHGLGAGGGCVGFRRICAPASRFPDGLFALPIDQEILERVSHPFPEEPVRTLDAIHLATALLVGRTVADLALLSLDD